MSIRLRRGGAYLADLDTLRRLAEANEWAEVSRSTDFPKA